jgi:hypothetical protein
VSHFIAFAEVTIQIVIGQERTSSHLSSSFIFFFLAALLRGDRVESNWHAVVDGNNQLVGGCHLDRASAPPVHNP